MAEVQTPPVVDKNPTEKSDRPETTGTNGNSTDGSQTSLTEKPALQHQTSIGSPEPIANDDLSEELLTMGWRKYWSKRENMPYFFNKITNESLWEMPQVYQVTATVKKE